jgi:RHS repeat-associated protein
LILVAATQTGDYTFNANSQRVKKTAAGLVTYFIYNQQGQLITESAGDGTIQAEYIYLNGQPIAKIDSNGISYIHIDHLGTPVMMTDATKAKVWEIETGPFGDVAIVTGTASLNIRFPGHHFDQESGLNYNYFRDYSPGIGRYVETDPIGINNGDNHLCKIRSKLDTDSDLNWTVIPEKIGHSIRF